MVDHAGRFQQDADLGKASKVDIVGAGLAGRLTAVAMLSKWPTLDLRLIERAPLDLASRTWCFHEGDLKPCTLEWLEPLISRQWTGYDVYFPRHRRSFSSRYFAIQSDHFFRQTTRLLRSRVSDVPRTDAELSILTTGWPKSTGEFEGGWQKFVGLDVTLKSPHGLTQPILMDATVEQLDGYRFVYCLPWSENSLLIEDTYYSNDPSLDLSQIQSRIREYATSKSWLIESVDRIESGSLPLAFTSSPEIATSNAVSLGAASGLAHPVTGYTTSILFRQIEALLGAAEPTAQSFRRAVVRENIEIRSGFSYLHLLNRMMFRASDPTKRYKVLERFYTLPEDLIARFYASNLTLRDRIRVLVGRPPVPIVKAAREFALWSQT